MPPKGGGEGGPSYKKGKKENPYSRKEGKAEDLCDCSKKELRDLVEPFSRREGRICAF